MSDEKCNACVRYEEDNDGVEKFKVCVKTGVHTMHEVEIQGEKVTWHDSMNA